MTIRAAVNRSVAGSERQTAAFAESARQWTSGAGAMTANRSRAKPVTRYHIVVWNAVLCITGKSAGPFDAVDDF